MKLHEEYTLWRCPHCLARGWTAEPHGHIPSRHRPEDTRKGEWCQHIPETIRVQRIPVGARA